MDIPPYKLPTQKHKKLSYDEPREYRKSFKHKSKIDEALDKKYIENYFSNINKLDEYYKKN